MTSNVHTEQGSQEGKEHCFCLGSPGLLSVGHFGLRVPLSLYGPSTDISTGLYESANDAVTSAKNVDLQSSDLFSQSESYRSEMKVSAGFVFLRPLSFMAWVATLSVCLHMIFPLCVPAS